MNSNFYIHKLCADTGCNLKDLPRAMIDRDEWWEREPRASVRSVQKNDDDDKFVPICMFHVLLTLT